MSGTKVLTEYFARGENARKLTMQELKDIGSEVRNKLAALAAADMGLINTPDDAGNAFYVKPVK